MARPPRPALLSRAHPGATCLLAVLLLLLLLGLTPARANGATLDVVGPRGATVEIDGEVRGSLPLDSPLDVESGYRRLRVLLPGHRVHDERILVPEDYSDVVVALELRPLNRWNALAASTVFAGLGQLYERRNRVGWTMVALQGTALLTAAWAEISFQGHVDDYEAFDQQYRSAIAPLLIRRLREQRDQAWDDLETAASIRDAALISALAIGLWSVLDAWWGFETVVLDTEVPPFGESTTSSEDPELRVGWRVGF